MIWFLWVVLLTVGVIAWIARSRRRSRGSESLAELDRQELDEAEEEVRRLDLHQRPDEGWEGDDWGPGAPKGP